MAVAAFARSAFFIFCYTDFLAGTPEAAIETWVPEGPFTFHECLDAAAGAGKPWFVLENPVFSGGLMKSSCGYGGHYANFNKANPVANSRSHVIPGRPWMDDPLRTGQVEQAPSSQKMSCEFGVDKYGHSMGGRSVMAVYARPLLLTPPPPSSSSLRGEKRTNPLPEYAGVGMFPPGIGFRGWDSGTGTYDPKLAFMQIPQSVYEDWTQIGGKKFYWRIKTDATVRDASKQAAALCLDNWPQNFSLETADNQTLDNSIFLGCTRTVFKISEYAQTRLRLDWSSRNESPLSHVYAVKGGLLSRGTLISWDVSLVETVPEDNLANSSSFLKLLLPKGWSGFQENAVGQRDIVQKSYTCLVKDSDNKMVHLEALMTTASRDLTPLFQSEHDRGVEEGWHHWRLPWFICVRIIDTFSDATRPSLISLGCAQGRDQNIVAAFDTSALPLGLNSLVACVAWVDEGRCISTPFEFDVDIKSTATACREGRTLMSMRRSGFRNAQSAPALTPRIPPQLPAAAQSSPPPPPSSPQRDELSVLALSSLGHDASMAILQGGRVLAVLELERLANERHFSPIYNNVKRSINQTDFLKVYTATLQTLMDELKLRINSGESYAADTHIFDVGVLCTQEVNVFTLDSGWPVHRWVTVGHHVSHAALGLWDSDFENALVLSHDTHGIGTIPEEKMMFSHPNLNLYLASKRGWATTTSGNAPAPAADESSRQWGHDRVPRFVGQSGFAPEVAAYNVQDLPFYRRNDDDSSDTLSSSTYRNHFKVLISKRSNATAYQLVACLAPEIKHYKIKRAVPATKCTGAHDHPIPGRVMGYAGMGTEPIEGIVQLFKRVLAGGSPDISPYKVGLAAIEDAAVMSGLRGPAVLSDEKRREVERNVVLSMQRAFQLHLEEVLRPHVQRYGDQIDGIILTGGTALNVQGNQHVRDVFGLPVHVPSAPNDSGIAVGAAWIVQPPPPGFHASVAFAGMELFDKEKLPDFAARYGATWLGDEEDAGISRLSAELAAGAIIALVRGRQEFGPRALGHRSLVAVPLAGIKARMNKIKFREAWRPVAPMVATEAMSRVFDFDTDVVRKKRGDPWGIEVEVEVGGEGSMKEVRGKRSTWDNDFASSSSSSSSSGSAAASFGYSPYMSFAPRLRPEMKTLIPAVWHYDGTARPQTVTQQDEPWLHALLMAVSQQVPTGLPVLCNTSFNTRGEPLVNAVEDAVDLLADQKDIDFLYVNGWLFPNRRCGIGQLLCVNLPPHNWYQDKNLCERTPGCTVDTSSGN